MSDWLGKLTTALGDAGKGAATGAALGPIGAAAGGAIGLALDLVPDLAKIVGKDAGVAQQVVQTVQAVTGTQDPGLQHSALADPGTAADLRIQLAQIAADHEQSMEDARLDRFKAAVADVAGARSRDIQVRQVSGGRNTRSDVMLAITIVGIVSCLGIAIYGRLDGNSAIFGLVAGLVGLFSKCFADAFSFEFGSSAGSARKTELMAQQVPTPPSPGVIVPADDVQPK